MASQSDHETQWDSNHRLLGQLVKQSLFPDWIATVAFYTALHGIERYFARRNEHPISHLDRKNTLIKYQSQLGQQLLNDFSAMYNTSRLARYNCVSLTPSDIQDQLNRLARIDGKIGPMV